MPNIAQQLVTWAVFRDESAIQDDPPQALLQARDSSRHRLVPAGHASATTNGVIAVGPHCARKVVGMRSGHGKRPIILVDPVGLDGPRIGPLGRRRAQVIVCTSTHSLARCHRAGYSRDRCILISAKTTNDTSPWSHPTTDSVTLTAAASLRRRSDVRLMLGLSEKVQLLGLTDLRVLLPVEPGFDDCLEIAAAEEDVITGDVLPSFPTFADRCIVVGIGPPHAHSGILEALSAGQVVIALPNSPGKELIHHGDNGFHAHTIDEMAALVASLLHNPERGAQVGERALVGSESLDSEPTISFESLLDRVAAATFANGPPIEHVLAADLARQGHPRARDIIGIPVHDVTMDEAVALVARYVREPGHFQIATPNINFIMRAFRDASFRALLSRTALNIPDGAWVLWIARALGGQIREQVPGRILAFRIVEEAAQHGWRVFFLGAAPGVAERAAEAMTERYPGLQVAGTLSPMYNPGQPSAEDDTTVEVIRSSKADIVLVAYGMPKQDIWGDRYLERSGASACIGIGGTFDMMAGDYRTAPNWVRTLGLEFAWRTFQEPRRLFLRYERDATVFRHVASRRRATTVRSLEDEPVIPQEHDRRSPD